MLFKRKEIWYYKFTVAGETIYKSTYTRDKAKAQEIADKAKAEAWSVSRLGEKKRYLWQEAVVRFLSESQQKRSIETEKHHLRWLAQFLDNVYIDEINSDLIEEIIKSKLKVAGTTRVIRTTGMISAILNKACKQWQWIDRVPHIRKFKEEGQRLRWLTNDEAVRLLKELPDHTRAMATFTLATGLRESNVTGLEWNQIDMQRRIAWIHADQSKNGKIIRVPLNDDAVVILRQQLGKHHRRVFTYRGQPVEKAGTKQWRAALKRVGIENFCWHGLRHTWASWHVQAGTPLAILQELGGWSSYSMVQRYAHLAPEHLSDHAARVSGIVAKSVATDNAITFKK
jgi:integrase